MFSQEDGYDLYKNKNYDAAIQYYDNLINSNKKVPEANYGKGSTSYMQGDYDSALNKKDFKSIIILQIQEKDSKSVICKALKENPKDQQDQQDNKDNKDNKDQQDNKTTTTRQQTNKTTKTTRHSRTTRQQTTRQQDQQNNKDRQQEMSPQELKYLQF